MYLFMLSKNFFYQYNTSLSNYKILVWTKFKAFADDNSYVSKMVISIFDRVEYTVGKGENADYLHFLLFLQCYQKASFSWSLKSQNCVVKRYTIFFLAYKLLSHTTIIETMVCGKNEERLLSQPQL